MNAFGKAMKQAVLGGLALTVLGLGAAGAAELPKEGNYDFTACWSGVPDQIEFGKGYSAMSYEITGTTRSNPPGGLFDRNSYRCVGARASLNGKDSSMVTCEAVDPDGDRRLSYFSQQGDQWVRENVTGTGKYEGMVASGSVQPMPPFPTVKAGTILACNHQKGTYKLK